MAIALGVNVLVWPITSESELRRLLVTSLQHVATLAHLTCKTYARELNNDELAVRQVLVKELRSDYLALNARLEETSYEVVLSRWTLRQHAAMIRAVQGLQQALITASSAQDLIDQLDPQGVNSRHLLAEAETTRTFADFRHGIDLVIAEIVDELVGASGGPAAEPESDSALDAAEKGHEAPADRQGGHVGEPQGPTPASDAEERLGHALHTTPTPSAAQEQVVTIAARLKREVRESEERQRRLRGGRGSAGGSRSGSASRPGTPRSANGSGTATPTGWAGASVEELEGRGRSLSREGVSSSSNETATEQPLPGEEARPQKNPAPTTDPDKVRAVELDPSTSASAVDIFRKAWDAFARAQQNALVALIKDGALEVDDVLRIEAGMPSIKEMYAHRLPKAWTSSLIAQTPLARLRSRGDTLSHASFSEDDALDEEVPCSEALTKSYSLLFGLGQLTEELATLHDTVMSSPPRRRVRFFLASMVADTVRQLFRPRDGMKLQEALAVLHGKPYEPEHKSRIHYVVRAERWFWGQRSLYALKVAVGATIYTVFALAPSLQRHVFLPFGQVSALITVIVAIAPTLGGTLSTWLLQISGTGAGALVGLVVLEIFNNVGGYEYNPCAVSVSVASRRLKLTHDSLSSPCQVRHRRTRVTVVRLLVVQVLALPGQVHPGPAVRDGLRRHLPAGVRLQRHAARDTPVRQPGTALW